MPYWVVFIGRNPGIYTSWEEAKAETNRYSGSVHKRYPTCDEAEEALLRFHEDEFRRRMARSQHQTSVGASTFARPLENQFVVEREANDRTLAFVATFFVGFIACILVAHLFGSE